MQTDTRLGGAQLNPHGNHCTEQIDYDRLFPALIKATAKSRNRPEYMNKGEKRNQGTSKIWDLSDLRGLYATG